MHFLPPNQQRERKGRIVASTSLINFFMTPNQQCQSTDGISQYRHFAPVAAQRPGSQQTWRPIFKTS